MTCYGDVPLLTLTHRVHRGHETLTLYWHVPPPPGVPWDPEDGPRPRGRTSQGSRLIAPVQPPLPRK